MAVAKRVRIRDVFRLFARWFHVSFVLFLVFTYLVAIPLGVYFFYFTREGALLSSRLLIRGIPIFIAPFGGDPWWEPLFVMAGWWLAAGWLFAGLLLVLCACLFFAWTGPGEGLRGGLSKLKNFSMPWGNYLLMFPFLSCMALSSAFFLEDILFPSIGVPVGPVLPGMNPHFEFLLATNASVTEEIGFRLVPLGFASLFLLLAHKQNREFLKSVSWRQRAWILILSLLAPTMAKNKVGQGASIRGKNVLEGDQRFGRGLSKMEYSFVLLSSVAFGLAHLGSGPGNAISAFVSSVIWGYAYYIYGIAASIMLHSVGNYYLNVYYYTAAFYFPTLVYVYLTILFLQIFAGFILWAISFTAVLLVTVPRVRPLIGKTRKFTGLMARVWPVKRATKAEKGQVRTCPRCAAKLPVDARFCGVCGKRLKVSPF